MLIYVHFRHVDNHILYTLAQQRICELVSRVYKGGVHCHLLTRGGGGGGGGGAAIRWYEKNTNGALEDKAFINGLLVNRLKVR